MKLGKVSGLPNHIHGIVIGGMEFNFLESAGHHLSPASSRIGRAVEAIVCCSPYRSATTRYKLDIVHRQIDGLERSATRFYPRSASIGGAENPSHHRGKDEVAIGSSYLNCVHLVGQQILGNVGPGSAAVGAAPHSGRSGTRVHGVGINGALLDGVYVSSSRGVATATGIVVPIVRPNTHPATGTPLLLCFPLLKVSALGSPRGEAFFGRPFRILALKIVSFSFA